MFFKVCAATGLPAFWICIFFTPLNCFSQTLLETKDFILSLDSYSRIDVVSFNNTVDLDSGKSDDSTTYLGIDYSLGFKAEFKNDGPKLYLRLERNGPYDYDAPLFVHNTLMTSGGVIEKYHNDELLPQLEEFWLDAPLFSTTRFKLGLYTYEVGNGFSLNGAYENYGFKMYRESEDVSWSLYYCRPDSSHKNHLGPRIRQEEKQDITYEHNAANFFAADIKFSRQQGYLWPYLGILTDYTSSGKRENLFAAPIERDILGTLGLALNFKQDKLSFNFEAAHNFGKAQSSDPAYKDISHAGYLIYAGLEYRGERFNPSFKFLLGSGNKPALEAAQNREDALTGSKNRAFSYYSPLNMHLGDSVSSSNVDMLPIVAMGGGYGLNYGVPRPGTFSSGDFDNLIMPSIGLDFNATEKFCIGLYGYYLSSFEKAVGIFNGEAGYLSRDLGYELDLFLDYTLNKNILVSLLAGYFFPGRYYKEERDDEDGSQLSPFVRGGGGADPAYQIELALEFKF